MAMPKPYYTTKGKSIYLTDDKHVSRKVALDEIMSYSPQPEGCLIVTRDSTFMSLHRMSGVNEVDYRIRCKVCAGECTRDSHETIKTVRYIGIDRLIDSEGLN